MTEHQRTRTVLNHLEAVRADVERTVDQSDSREHWRALVRGTLMHWLGVLFDAGQGHTADLETANRVLIAQVERLKKINAVLQQQLNSERAKNR